MMEHMLTFLHTRLDCYKSMIFLDLTSDTLIDHIETTNKSNIVTFGVHETSISDP